MASEGQDRADTLGWGRRPNRPKTFARNPTIPHKSTECFYLRQSAGVLRDVIQDPANGLRRILLPGSRLNSVGWARDGACLDHCRDSYRGGLLLLERVRA